MDTDKQVERIAREVRVEFNCSQRDFQSRRRLPRAMLARQVAYYLCYEYTDATLTGLGRFFQRDHTTVVYGVNKIRSMLEEGNAQLQRSVDTVIQLLDLKSGDEEDEDAGLVYAPHEDDRP